MNPSPWKPLRRFWGPSDDLTQGADALEDGVIVDTVFDQRMHPVVAKEPEEVMRILSRPHPETWSSVLIGETKQVVTIEEYLYKDLLKQVVKTLHELAGKKDLGMYQRNPERWEEFVTRTAVQLIRRIKEDK